VRERCVQVRVLQEMRVCDERFAHVRVCVRDRCVHVRVCVINRCAHVRDV
jgi:hypothetical protein